jgi:hypothetical protein
MVTGLCMMLSITWSSTVWADEEELRDRLNAARTALAEMQADPVGSESTEVQREIEYARIDIDEAADRLANHLEELAEVSVIRVENRVTLVRGMIEQLTVEGLAEERETAAIDMTREADQAQVEFESSEARKNALRDEVTPILNNLQVE